jgi:hypothetical protein
MCGMAGVQVCGTLMCMQMCISCVRCSHISFLSHDEVSGCIRLHIVCVSCAYVCAHVRAHRAHAYGSLRALPAPSELRPQPPRPRAAAAAGAGPFNYPFNETYTTLIPAILMGNSVVMKLPNVGCLGPPPPRTAPQPHPLAHTELAILLVGGLVLARCCCGGPPICLAGAERLRPGERRRGGAPPWSASFDRIHCCCPWDNDQGPSPPCCATGLDRCPSSSVLFTKSSTPFILRSHPLLQVSPPVLGAECAEDASLRQRAPP